MITTNTINRAVNGYTTSYDVPSTWITCGTPDCTLCKRQEEDYKLEQAKKNMTAVNQQMQALRDSYSKAANLVKEINNQRAAEETRLAKEKADKERAKREEELRAKQAADKAKRKRKALTDRDTSSYVLALVDQLVDDLPKDVNGVATTLAFKGFRGTRRTGSSNALALYLAKEANAKAKYYYGDNAPKITVYVEMASIIIETPRFQITFDVQDHITDFMSQLTRFKFPAITNWS